MQEPKAVRRELRTALTTITGKWKLELLWLLNQRVPHFGELQRGIPEVTQHVLTTQLCELELIGLSAVRSSEQCRREWSTQSPTGRVL
jgi:DNA-binding HxlR family transcriptional regulator